MCIALRGPKRRSRLMRAIRRERWSPRGATARRPRIRAGLVDTLGDRIAFGRRVAALAGADSKRSSPALIRHCRFVRYLAAHPEAAAGKVGVLTVAGDIVPTARPDPGRPAARRSRG
jgi:hypothetical protein